MTTSPLPVVFTMVLLSVATVSESGPAVDASQKPLPPRNIRILPPTPTTPAPTPPAPVPTPVDPEPPTNGVSSFSCGATTDQFWNNLLSSGYTVYSQSLRNPAQLRYVREGGLVSENGPNNWSYDAAEDAALISIPEYWRTAFKLATPVASTGQTTVMADWDAGVDPSDHFKCGNEVFRITSINGPGNWVVSRAQRGTTASTHAAGTVCLTSGNSVGADIRLPSPSTGAAFNPPLNKDGDSYLIMWDNKFDESYRVNRSGFNNDVYKHVQFWTRSHLSNPGGATYRWLEFRVGFCDGCGGEQPPDFDPSPGSSHIAYLDFRCYGGGGGPADWLSQPGGRTLFGPNANDNGNGAACYTRPAKKHFIVDANRWFRRATEIRTQVNSYDLINSWAKSETRPLVKLLDQLQASLRFSDGETDDARRMMTVMQLEIDTSKQSLDGREIGSVLKQWLRNVWIGRNVPPNVRDQILACNVAP